MEVKRKMDWNERGVKWEDEDRSEKKWKIWK